MNTGQRDVMQDDGDPIQTATSPGAGSCACSRVRDNGPVLSGVRGSVGPDLARRELVLPRPIFDEFCQRNEVEFHTDAPALASTLLPAPRPSSRLSIDPQARDQVAAQYVHHVARHRRATSRPLAVPGSAPRRAQPTQNFHYRRRGSRSCSMPAQQGQLADWYVPAIRAVLLRRAGPRSAPASRGQEANYQFVDSRNLLASCLTRCAPACVRGHDAAATSPGRQHEQLRHRRRLRQSAFTAPATFHAMDHRAWRST